MTSARPRVDVLEAQRTPIPIWPRPRAPGLRPPEARSTVVACYTTATRSGAAMIRARLPVDDLAAQRTPGTMAAPASPGPNALAAGRNNVALPAPAPPGAAPP